MIPTRKGLQSLTLRALPFSDAVSAELPLAQLLRLSLFQVSVGMASVMLLNDGSNLSAGFSASLASEATT